MLDRMSDVDVEHLLPRVLNLVPRRVERKVKPVTFCMRNGSEERLRKAVFCVRNGSATPREEGFAKQTQVMLLGR